MHAIRAAVFLTTLSLTAPLFCASTSQPLDSSLVLVSPSEPGDKLVITGHLVDTEGIAIASARVHVYQTDASGYYTPDKPMDEAHARLAGWLQTDRQGNFLLTTIRPGGYPKALRLGDRERKIPAHIHFDIYRPQGTTRKVQVIFADDPLLSDSYWQDWVKKLHQPVLSVHRNGSGQAATLNLSLAHGEQG